MPKSFKELSEEQMRQKRQQNFSWTTPYTSAGSAHSYNQQLYDDLLNREIGKAYQYATTGSKQNEDMANILLNGITQYKPGDVDSFDFQTARQSVIDNDVVIKALRGYGIFDDVGYAYNPSSIGLVSDNFLKMLSGTLPEDIANSVKLDEQDRLTRNKNAEIASGLKSLSTDYYHGLSYDELLDVYGGSSDEVSSIVGNWIALAKLQDSNYAGPQSWDDLRNIESDEEYQEWLDKLHTGWTGAEWNTVGQTSTYKSRTDEYRGYLKIVEDEIARRSELGALQASIRGDLNYGTLSTYGGHVHPEGSLAAKNPDDFDHYYDLQYFINNPVLPEGYSSKTSEDWIRHYQQQGYDFLTAEEIADYNALISAGRTEDAKRYLELLQPELYSRRASVMEIERTVRAQHLGYGALDSAKTLFENPLAAITTNVGGLFGIDDPNHFMYDLQRNVNTTRTVYGQTLGNLAPSARLFDQNVLTMGYNVLMSLGDMAVAKGIGGSIASIAGGKTAFAKNAMQFIMSSESSASTILNDLQNGWTAEQATAHGLLNGVIEAWTERGFMDSLFSEGGTFASRLRKSGADEGLEEIEAGALQIASDALIAFIGDHESEAEQVYKSFEKSMSPSEAAGMTLQYFAKQLAADGLAGFASGGLMQAGVTTAQNIDAVSVGNTLKNQGDLEGMLAIAEGMDRNSESYKQSSTILGLQKGNKAVSNYRLGKLVRALAYDLGEEKSAIISKTYDEAIENRLVELGEDAQSAKTLAPVIRQAANGKTLSGAERSAVKWTDNASTVLKELTVNKEGDSASSASEQDGPLAKTVMKKASQNVSDVTAKQFQFREALTTKSSSASAIAAASKKTAELRKGKPQLRHNAIAFSDESGEQKQGNFKKVVKRGTDFFYAVSVDGSDTLTEVSPEKLTNIGSDGLSTIVNYAQGGARHDMSEAEVNILAATYAKQGGDVNAFIHQFENAYLSGYSSIEQGVSDMAPELAKIAYDYGKAEAAADEVKRVERAKKARKVSNPTVGWLGDVSSDDQIKGSGDAAALDEATKGMTETQQAMVEFGKHLAKSANINVAFFASSADSEGKLNVQNGSYDPNTHTIYLDINSGASTEKGRQALQKSGTLGAAIGRVAGHELTHVLEAASPEYYAQYKQAVKKALRERNQDYATLVRSKIDTSLAAGEKLTYAGAEAEVIADASEYMLQDSKFVKNMDQGLMGKVKEIVQNFLNKVNEAFRALTGGHIESAALRTMTDGVAHYEKQLQDLWDMAFDEMLGAEVIKSDVSDALYETGEIYSYTTQKSRRVSDKETIAYLENQKHITTYRAMQVIDGELYPPMAEFIGSKKAGNREDPGVIGRWEMAVEHPELIKWVDGKPKFELKKTNDDGSVSTVPAAYNPYMHSSNTVLNDQFSKAFQRKNLVVVECVVPVSESDGAYRAQYAKDATGWHEWKSGVVAGDLAKQKSGFRRDVFLSRYIKPVRILSDTEVAEKIAGYLDGTDVTVPFQSAWPTLREALVKAGVNVTEPRGLGASQMKIAMEAFEEWKNSQGEQMKVGGQEKVQYAIRDGLITEESTEQERYNVLKNAVLKLAHVNTDRLEDEDLEQYNTRKKSDVEKPFLKLAAKLGITKVDLENSYIDFPFRFSNGNLRKNLKHQLDYGGTFEDHAKMMSCLEELVDNAIPVEMHPEKKNGTKRANPSLRNVYVLISAYRDGNDIVPVQLEVKEFWNNDNGLYVAVALTKMTPEVVEKPAARNTGVTALLFSEDTISLRYLFENVNSSDYKFFKYIPDGFLSDEQKAAKARALSDQAEEYASYGKDGDNDSSPDGIEIDDDTESAYPTQKSIRTWAESDYVAHRNEAAERLAKTIGVSTAKAKKWIDDVNSISAYILGNKARLDYVPTAVKGMSAFKSNPEYGGSIDMSTICAKRRLATGTLDAIQRVLGDAVLTKDDFLHIREMMKERGHEVACGLCFVESSRKNLSKYNKQFLDQYKTEHPDSELGMVDLNTVEGLERIRSNPETADVYAAYEKFMNKLAQRKPKLFEKRTEYNHEILKKFKSDTTVGVKNRNGGLRLQSFSDFEIVHLIDMMQVITDMASVGLAGQAYTKVPDFAWALGDTGLKINLSLIAKDVDADGNLVFDDVEGMNHIEAEKLRNAYSKNVGTIVVTFTDEQTIAAMKSDFIDYIIPFHRSQWQKGDYKKLGLPEGTKDYTLHQNEKEGRKRVKENFLPNAYWQDNLSGTENAKYYLDMCAKAGRTPKFAKFLVNNGDGSYSLQPDGSTDGYWKLLIDFKMYDNEGNRSKQLPVQPNFNMEQAMRMLEEYKGEHDSFPVAQDVVDAFVKEYRGDVGGVKHTGGRYTVSPIQKSIRDLPENTTTYRDVLTEADNSIAATVEERNALSIYQKLLKNHAEASEKVIKAESALAAASEADKPEARRTLAAARAKQKDLYNRLINVERTAHVQTMVNRTNQLISDLSGKDTNALNKMVSDRERRIESLKADITGLKGAARAQREADIREREREVSMLKSKAAQNLLENSEKYQKQIADIRLRRDLNIEIGKRTRHIKRVVKRLNDRIVHEEDYKNVKEPLKPVVHKLVQTFIDGFGSMVFDQKTADHLRSVYEEIAKDDGAPEFYSDDVANWLGELASMKEWDALIRAEGSSSLGAAEEKLIAYTRVAEIADHIYKLVTAADEIFVNGKREKFNAFSTETGSSLIAHKDAPLLVGKARDAFNAFQNLLSKGNLTPQYFFEHLKNSGMTRLFDGLMRGQTEYAQATRDGQEFISSAKKRYNFYAWQNMKTGIEFHTEQGHDIVLTTPQMMWVYATAKREATNRLMDTHHLDQGGFRYAANDLPKQKGKLGKAVPGSDRLHRLSQADVEKISNTLTAEQKACADELVSYLSNECAEMGNRASMELFGIKKYNEEYYFPFKTASDQRHQRSDTGSTSTTNDARVKHASFTHSLQKGANTPLVMGNFFDVISEHINLMATYSSFVVPIESMNRVLNTKINDEEDGSGSDVTIRSLIGRKYGEAAQKYVADLLKDLNGGPQTDNRGGLSALFRAFKRGAVMGSLSVALQQPTAIVRAFAYVNPKYFAHITMERSGETWKRMMKHSGTAVIKDMGKFDVGTGHTAVDWIANSDIQDYNVIKRAKFLLHTEGWLAVKDNMIEFLTAMPGIMDRITWTHIWKAVEAEQAELHPEMDRNSDAFLDMVGERFDDVINHTQVYDSVLAKSQNMRSKNPLTQMSTAFMSEATLNANMYYSAFTGDHTAGKRAGMIASVIASNVLAQAAASLISAWNKDDDKRKLSEKYLAEFASRTVDSLNPVTMYPYLSDLWSMVSGYDIERTDMSVVKDVWEYGSTFVKKIAEGEDITWRDRENFYGTIANLFGIPGKNVSRDFRRIRNLIFTDKSASSPESLKYTLYENAIPLGLWKDSNKAYCQRLVAAVIDGDTQEAYDLWEYLKNTKQPSESTINSGIRDELKRLVKEGRITPSQATTILKKYAPYKNDKDNFNKPKEWAE